MASKYSNNELICYALRQMEQMEEISELLEDDDIPFGFIIPLNFEYQKIYDKFSLVINELNERGVTLKIEIK